MKVLFTGQILIDAIFRRDTGCVELLRNVADGRIQGCVTLETLCITEEKCMHLSDNRKRIKEVISAIVAIMNILALSDTEKVLLSLGVERSLEECSAIAAADQYGCIIATHDPGRFVGCDIVSETPDSILARINA